MDIKNKILAIAPESVVENEELLTISVSAKDFRAVVEWIKSIP